MHRLQRHVSATPPSATALICYSPGMRSSAVKPFQASTTSSPQKLILTALLSVAIIAPATAQSDRLTGSAAFGDWRADRPGLVRLIRPADLPKPGATPSFANAPRVVPRPAAAVPQVPPGFKIELLAEGLNGPRQMRTAPNGDIFVAETYAGRIRVLRLSGDG